MPFHHRIKDNLTKGARQLKDEIVHGTYYYHPHDRLQDEPTEPSEGPMQVFTRSVDLREYQVGWDNLQDAAREIDPKALKAVYNYIGKGLYGRNAKEEIIVRTLKRDLKESLVSVWRHTIDWVLFIMLDLGLIDTSENW